MKRRDFLIGIGCIGAGGIAIGGARPVKATHVDLADDDITREFDQDLLSNYNPRLITSHLDNPPLGMHCFKANSPDHDTTALVYWLEHVNSGETFFDSHFGDHEPLYIFVDEDDGTIQEVVYTGYHWLVARTRNPNIFSDEDGNDHVTYKVNNPWHHYVETQSVGVEQDLSHLSDATFESWLDNGLEDDLAYGSVMDPWTMATIDGGNGRTDWWQDDLGSFSINATLARIWHSVGLAGADESDI